MPRRRALGMACLALSGALGWRSARAALKVGAKAPLFVADAALAGKDFRFDLAAALARGPVVLYFYPKAFTSGCTVEAHLFAQAQPRFQALGASVIGMSGDDIATLRRFSVEACRSQFPVAADPAAVVMKQYDAALGWLPGTADRISYVIAPDRTVLFVHAGMSPDEHVRSTLEVVERWARQQPAGGAR